MNRKLLILVGGICAAGVLLIAQSIAMRSVKAENRRLRTELAELREKVAGGLAGKQGGSVGLAEEQFQELLRLRGEVSQLRTLEEAQNEKSGKERQAAFNKLPEAEARLARLSMLHSEGLLSSRELNQADMEVQLLEAEINGAAEVEKTRIKLRFAEENLARYSELHKAGLISKTDFEEATANVESLKALLGTK